MAVVELVNRLSLTDELLHGLRLYLGDCLGVMRSMPEASVDTILCDPPYGLSDPNRRAHCIEDALREVGFPEFAEDVSTADYGRPPGLIPLDQGEPFGTPRTASGDARVNMGTPAVHLDDHPQFRQEEVARDPALAISVIEGELARECNTQDGQCLGHFALVLGGQRDSTLGGDMVNRTTAQFHAGGFRIGVGLQDYALDETQSAASVVALAGAELGSMLAFDVGRNSLELLATDAAGKPLCPCESFGPRLVRTGATAGGLPPELQSIRIGVVDGSADGAGALHLHLVAPSNLWNDLIPIIARNGFMGKAWDADIPGPEVWRECYRVAKPGAFLLAFGGTRSWHRLACALEDAGWVLRDTICVWMYGSGFPKGHDISKAIDKQEGAEREVVGKAAGMGRQNPEWGGTAAGRSENSFHPEYDLTAPATDAARLWDGWNVALKPAWEPILVAMKPCEGSFADNALKHGVAGLWIDGARVEGTPEATRFDPAKHNHDGWRFDATGAETALAAEGKGRWPANLLLGCACESEDHDPDCPVRMLDEQAGPQKSGGSSARRNSPKTRTAYGEFDPDACPPGIGGSSGGVSRFFYCAKSSRGEREDGLRGVLPCVVCGELDSTKHQTPDGREASCIRNDHNTVKPLSLMRYLVRLTKTPTGGVVLDPFLGSGTTGVACCHEGRQFIGIDMNEHYLDIACARINAVSRPELPGLE